ncbi:MAG: ABC transporter permease [Bacillota bacterium]|nr:ABC transporter permease [Bacillota bacterium]
MLRYIGKRILWMIPVILGVLLIVFGLSEIAPGDPVDQIVGYDAPEEIKEAKREELGLNRPFLIRYVDYVKGIVTRGDLGTSYSTKLPVFQEVMQKYPNTVKLALLAIAVALIIGIPLGVISAVKQYTFIDNASMVFALFGVSVPQFWFALMMMLIFAVKLRWLPASSATAGPIGLVMPVAMIGIANVGNIARTTRSSMLEVIRQDYIRTARAKGQKENKVIFKHALQNALIPVVANVGNSMASSLGGAVVAEQVFSVDGVGRYMLTAINARNWPAVCGGLVILAITFSVVMLLVDLVYTVVDPRLKDEFNAASKMAAQKRAFKKAAKQKAAEAKA